MSNQHQCMWICFICASQVVTSRKMMLNKAVKVQRQKLAACMTRPFCNKLFRDVTIICGGLHACESLSPPSLSLLRVFCIAGYQVLSRSINDLVSALLLSSRRHICACRFWAHSAPTPHMDAFMSSYISFSCIETCMYII